MINFIFIPKTSKKAILDYVVNKYSLKRYLTSFLILNKDLPPKNRRLIIMGLEVINIKIKQAGESLTLTLQMHSRYISDIINLLAFQPLTLI